MALSQNIGRPIAEGIPGGSSSEPAPSEDTATYVQVIGGLPSLTEPSAVVSTEWPLLLHVCSEYVIKQANNLLQDDEDTITVASEEEQNESLMENVPTRADGPSTSRAQTGTVRTSSCIIE
ncbi:hypothetical protein MHYP_G00147690 [Metynnis hypsauchen]